jgi:hypothetical protein
MEEANRWGCTSEMLVRCKPERACPTPQAPPCCPSAATSPRPRSRTRRHTGWRPERARAHLAVAPKAHGQRGPITCGVASLTLRQSRPLLSSGPRVLWYGPKRRQTGRSSRRFYPLLWCLESGGRLARWGPRRSGKPLCLAWIACAWRPPHGPRSGHTRRPHSGSLTAGHTTASVAKHGQGAA